MNVNISINFDNMTDAAPVLAALAALSGNVQVTAAPVAASTDEAPKATRGKGKKTQTALEQLQQSQQPAGAPVTQVVAVDPSNVLGFAPQPSGLDALISGVSAASLPPSPTPQPVAQVQQIQAQPVVVGQKQLIEAFTALGSAPGKGPDAIRAVLAQFGAATVTAIPVEQYANAVAACKKVLAG
jgi:hypothetical protein